METIYQKMTQLIQSHETFALCILVQTSGSTPRQAGSKMLVFPDGSIWDTIGGGEVEQRVIEEALTALAEGKPRNLSYSMVDPAKGDPGVCGGQMEVYVEPVLPQKTVIVIGAGHVGQAVVRLAHWLGFYVVASDDRPEFITPESVRDADELLSCPITELVQKVKIHPQTYLVLTTRNVELDAQVLPALLKSPAAYIGVIGSRRRWQTTRKMLLEKGIAEEEIDRVHSPMGLDIKAETPEEIAVSILAQIIMLRQGGDGSMMKS